ncbi:hypothetical protein Daqu01_01172 [Deinococcus aquaticus]
MLKRTASHHRSASPFRLPCCLLPCRLRQPRVATPPGSHLRPRTRLLNPEPLPPEPPHPERPDPDWIPRHADHTAEQPGTRGAVLLRAGPHVSELAAQSRTGGRRPARPAGRALGRGPGRAWRAGRSPVPDSTGTGRLAVRAAVRSGRGGSRSADVPADSRCRAARRRPHADRRRHTDPAGHAPGPPPAHGPAPRPPSPAVVGDAPAVRSCPADQSPEQPVVPGGPTAGRRLGEPAAGTADQLPVGGAAAQRPAQPPAPAARLGYLPGRGAHRRADRPE